MLVLTRDETASLLDPDALRDAVAAAMRDLSAGAASIPLRTTAVVPDRGALLAMPGYLPRGGLAAKLVTQFPGNTTLPTHLAVIVVFDPDTGQPTALLDGTAITTARTAAGSALSVDLLARPDARTLAILGTGVQARAHAYAVVRVRAIELIKLAGRDRDRAEAFAAQLRDSLGIAVDVADGFDAAYASADIVCATTHATTPVVRHEHLAPGTHVTSVGYNTAGREVDSATVAGAAVFVESRDAVLADVGGSNDIRVPIDEGLVRAEQISEIGELIAGTRPGRTSAEQLTLYKSVGVAAQDIAAAALVLDAARATGAGVEVAL